MTAMLLVAFANCLVKKMLLTWLLHMMTSSNGNIFRVTGPLCGEFTGPGEFPTQRPVTRGIDVFFDLRLNKRLSKQPWGWWFETLSWSLWCQCNDCMFQWLLGCTRTQSWSLDRFPYDYIAKHIMADFINRRYYIYVRFLMKNKD